MKKNQTYRRLRLIFILLFFPEIVIGYVLFGGIVGRVKETIVCDWDLKSLARDFKEEWNRKK